MGTGMDVIRPEDADYDEVRTVFNSMVDKRPAVIAQCATSEDVIDALAMARADGHEVAVRAGGHSVAGMCLNDGGLVIDVRPMKQIEVDPGGRDHPGRCRLDVGRVRSGDPGARPGHHRRSGVDHRRRRAHPRRWVGLARARVRPRVRQPPFGRSGHRRRAAVTASESEHPDLFWALHGGGGNFGVVTSFEFALHPVGPMVLAGSDALAGRRGRRRGSRVPRPRARTARRARLGAGVSHRPARGVRARAPPGHDAGGPGACAGRATRTRARTWSARSASWPPRSTSSGRCPTPISNA